MILCSNRLDSARNNFLPLYTQIATKFAELHDTSLRMAAKGVIKEVLDWRNSRSVFYRRLHRRIGEHSLINSVRDAAGDQLSHVSAMNLLKDWFLNSDVAKGREEAWLDDEAFFRWRDDPANYEDKLKELRVQRLLLQLTNIGDSALDLQALPQGLAALLSKLEASSRDKLTDELRKVLG